MRANDQQPNFQQHRTGGNRTGGNRKGRIRQLRFENDTTTIPAASRPSDLLPWADPYIARLVAKLQEEVRDERAQSQVDTRITGACLAEMEPPCPSTENDWDWKDETRWSVHEDK